MKESHYAVAVNVSGSHDELFSITCRDLLRSPHWVAVTEYPYVIRDSRNPQYKPYMVLGSFGNETEARKFKTVIEAAYIANGYQQEYINA